MAGAIHRILLGNQEAAATWLPFAIGQFYACPEGAQTSFTPVPGVTILVKRVGGQDVVQITAGGDPDFVLYDNAVPTTASGPPLVFVPNNPERKTVGPTNASASLANIGDGKLFASHGVGLQNDTTQPYTERLTVWNYVGPWYAVIGGKDLVSPAAQSLLTVRPTTVVADTRKEITPGGPRVHRLVAIQVPDWDRLTGHPGGIHISDDLGATWQSYAYPSVAERSAYLISLGLYRIDVDTLMYVVWATGLGLDSPPYVVRGTEGGLVWYAQTDIDGESTEITDIVNLALVSAIFYPCKTPGVALGLATMLGTPVNQPPEGAPDRLVLRALRTINSGEIFSKHDYEAPYGGELDNLTEIAFDNSTNTYATLLFRGTPLGSQNGTIYPMMMVTSNDEGLTWQLHPVYELYSTDPTNYYINVIGFYQGRFYISFLEDSPGKRAFAYSTNDYGVTWVKHAHSDHSGRTLSHVVQLHKSRKAFPHRDDM